MLRMYRNPVTRIGLGLWLGRQSAEQAAGLLQDLDGTAWRLTGARREQGDVWLALAFANRAVADGSLQVRMTRRGLGWLIADFAF